MMSEENEIIAEEIYEYYKNKVDDEPKKVPVVSEIKEETVKKKHPSPAKAISGMTGKLSKSIKERKRLYIALVILSSVIIIVGGAVVGILIPKDESRVGEELEKLRSASSDYATVKSENERLKERVNGLYGDQAEVAAKLEGITDYEAIRDRAKQDMDDVSKQLEEVKAQVDLKQSQINELDQKIKDMGGKITLKPGMYTVGEHIAAGEYHVRGNGSILVSDSDSKLKINTKLSQTSSVCRLSDGDTIKLETEADFNPAE